MYDLLHLISRLIRYMEVYPALTFALAGRSADALHQFSFSTVPRIRPESTRSTPRNCCLWV